MNRKVFVSPTWTCDDCGFACFGTHHHAQLDHEVCGGEDPKYHHCEDCDPQNGFRNALTIISDLEAERDEYIAGASESSANWNAWQVTKLELEKFKEAAYTALETCSTAKCKRLATKRAVGGAPYTWCDTCGPEQEKVELERLEDLQQAAFVRLIQDNSMKKEVTMQLEEASFTFLPESSIRASKAIPYTVKFRVLPGQVTVTGIWQGDMEISAGAYLRDQELQKNVRYFTAQLATSLSADK